MADLNLTSQEGERIVLSAPDQVEIRLEPVAQPTIVLSGGLTGGTGPAGADGADGQGVPTGGTSGQVLAKASGTDYDTEWVEQSAGGGGAWGEITGTLSAQTDLQSALDAKAASSHTHTEADITDLGDYATSTELTTGLATKAATSHTHTASNVTDFDTEVSNNTDVAANTAARHTHSNSAVLNATTASFTTADETKLDGIEASAEVNNISDANATDLTDGGASTLHYHTSDRDRANHTGAQAISTVTGLQTALDGKASSSHTHAHGDITDFDTELAGTSNTTAFTPTADYHPATKKYVDDEITGAGGYNDEAAQDAIGTILTDTAEIDLTYNDATPSITASIVAGSIDETKLDASVNASLDLADSATQPGDLATVATTGAYSDLSGTPTIPTVSDTAYDATSWNGNTDAPTKNAVRDKIESMASGSGDVVGPASSTDNAIARFDSTSGKLVQNSTVIISDTNTVLGSGLSGLTLESQTGTDGTTIKGGSGTGYIKVQDDAVSIIGSDLSLGTNDITNVGTVDGRDVSADGATLDGHTTAIAGKADTVHTHPTTDLTATGGTSTSFLRKDNTWATPTNTTYTEITTAEIDAGTASTLRTMTGRRAQYIVDKVASATQTMTNKTLTTPTIDQVNSAAPGLKKTMRVQTDNSNTIANTTQNGVFEQRGWGQALGNSTGTISEAVTFPTAFTTVLGVIVTPLGAKVSPAASDITGLDIALTGAIGYTYSANPVSTTGFTANLNRDSGTFGNTVYYGYSWIAWGV